MSVKRRKLGKSGLTVASIGLGCMSMSEFYGEADEREAIATIHRAIELGIDLLDTADVYGLGKNEELVGKAIKDRRAQILLATKFGIVRKADGSFVGVNGRPDYVKSACEASLRRLGVETIDLYYQHRVDPKIPIEETMGALAQLVAEGKVRYLGLSEAAPDTIERAAKVHEVAALQSEYSLFTREHEAEVLPTVRALGIAFVAYSPLGRGFLTGAIKTDADLSAGDWRRGVPRFGGEHFARNVTLVEEVEALAKGKGCTPAQLALAWVLAQGDNIVPIPGTKRRKYLEENVGALEVTLSKDELARIDALQLAEKVSGARYPDLTLVTVK